MPKIIGIDIGYGMTKVIDSAGRVDKFKSIVGAGAPEILGLPTSKNSFRTTTIDGNTYTIGEDAERFKLPLLSVRKRNSIESVAYKALLKTALKDDVYNNVKIVTGLPVSFINDSERLKKVIIDVIQGANITVIPQPAGTFFDLLLDSSGNIANREYADMQVGIIDIGSYTTDILFLSEMDVVKELSGTVTIGIHTLMQKLSKACSNKRRYLTLTELENALTTGYITKFGEKIGIMDSLNSIRDLVAQDIWSYVNSMWGAEEQIDLIVLSGGGAPILENSLIQSKTTDTANIISVKDTFMANVYGFFKLGMRLYANKV
jgi:plasmid segregation protein ParM